jgi:phospholipid N-methyltransferase
MSSSWEEARRENRIARNAGGGPLWHFLRGFIKHPVMVGAAVPSSKATVDKVLSKVDWAACKVFVEYGPGVGTFT